MPVKTLSDIFFESCKTFGEHTAVIHNDGRNVKKLTYKELEIESGKVTKCLNELCAQGFVGIYFEQDISLPAVILGILHSNLPFVYIDTQDPQDRVLHRLRHLCVKWVFTRNSCPYGRKVLANFGTEVKSLYLSDIAYVLWCININTESKNKLLSVPYSFQLAYAIETSGSTGPSKTVFVPHQCILPNISDISKMLNLQQNDIIFLASPLTFDPGIVDLFLPFTCGGALLIVPSLVRASPLLLLEILFPMENKFYTGITILQITPSLFLRWSLSDIRTRILGKTTTLKKLLLGGEPCPNTAIIKTWKDVGNETEIYNIYGITEVSCWASAEQVNLTLASDQCELSDVTGKSMLDVPLGSALSKTLMVVRDEDNCQIFNGEGELYIGSTERICLINEEILSELCPPVFRATGDIVKVDMPTNRIMFVGRKNRIIKRWGHQVCLSGVEMVLNKHPSVEACCCIWDQLKNVLTLAVIWTENEEKQSLRLFSLNHLHKSEVPDKIITVKSFPLTNHGKIDFKKLHSILLDVSMKEPSIESTSLSSQIRCAWKNVTGQEPHESEKFMTSGGNSLLALQLTSELEKTFGEIIRNKIINMLLNNCSLLEIEQYLLKPEYENRNNLSDVEFGFQSAKRSNNVKDCDCSKKKKTAEIHEQLEMFPTEESLQPGLEVIRKRKLSSEVVSQVAKEEKIEMLKESTLFDEERSSSSVLTEDKLVKVCCRGAIFLKEPVSDFFMLNQEDKINLKFKWKFDLRKCVDASPCYLKFAKKSWVVVGSHSHILVVLQCPSGKVVSTCELPDRIESSVCPSSCGKYGIVGCYNGCVYCISLSKGVIIWSYLTGDMVKSTPVLCLRNTAVVVGSYDSTLYCINVENGTLVWNVSPSKAGIYSSPCISNRSEIFIATLDGTCVSLCENTGLQHWKTQVSSPVFASPVLAQSAKAVIFAEVVGTIHCFSAIKGDKLWEFKANGQVFSSFSTIHYLNEHYELLVFGSHDKNIYCLKWNNDDSYACLNWKQEVDSSLFATPFIFKVRKCLNTLSNMSSDNIVTYVAAAATKGLVYLLNVEDGSIKYVEQLPYEIFSSPIVCDGQLIVGCRDNHLYNYSL